MTFDAGAIEAKLTLDRAQFKAELAAARAEGDAFARRRFTAKLDVDATAPKASMASASAVYDTLRARLSQPIVVDVQTAGANAAILTTIGLLDKLHAKAGTIILPGGAGGGGRVGGGFFGLPRLFGGRVNLFGGILPGLLASIGTVHLLIDAFVELVAVILPATIAFGIFAAAAAPTVGDIATKMQQINTVVVATGKNIAPLTGAFTRMADAVRPSVYQLFGNALQIAGRNTGLFQQLAVGTGHVITDLAARFTLAATNGHGFNIFLANAVPDLAKLGD